MISRSAEYALRALVYMSQAGDRWAMNREIADELNLPPQFLTKILSTLSREGILASQRGKSGGFRLARDPAKITLLEIVDPFDRLTLRKRCVLGRSRCSDASACILHRTWSPLQDAFRESFAKTTLADIAEGSTRGRVGRKRQRVT